MTKIKIVTHSAGFHSDDVFGVATLALHLGDAPFEVLRTRDMDLIEKGDYVLDVGFEYDPGKNRFDHHQEGGAGERENGVPYASFGLVWKRFGAEICGSEEIARSIDKKLVQPIDSFDNGKATYTIKIEGVHPYLIQNVFFSMEPAWQEDKKSDETFLEAVDFAKGVILREITHFRAERKAQKITQELYEATEDKRLLVFDGSHNWDRILATKLAGEYPEPLYLVRPHKDKSWQVVAVLKDSRTFDMRKPLPAEWSGKKGDELSKVTGISDGIFCHRVGFMCVTASRESAITLAKKALES